MNVLLALSQHINAEIAEMQKEAGDALAQYVAARKRITELVALRELREALAALPDEPVVADPTVLPLSPSHAHAGGGR